MSRYIAADDAPAPTRLVARCGAAALMSLASVAARGRRLDHPALRRLLESAAVACLVVMAPVMVVAHRSSLLVLVLAAVFAILAAFVSKSWRFAPAVIAQKLASPLWTIALVAAIWALISIAWAPSRGAALRDAGEFLLPLAAGAVVAFALPPDRRPHLAVALGVALLLASAMVVADLATGLALRIRLGLRSDSFVLNRPALVLLVMLPASLLLLIGEKRPVFAVAVAVAVSAAIAISESGAARLGLAAAALAAAVTFIAPRLAVALAGAGLALALALAPIQGELSDRALPAAAHGALSESHSRERVDIWVAYGAALRSAPWIGHGFGSSSRLDPSVTGLVAPGHAFYLAVGHPHSVPLQLWTEIGAVGVGLVAAVLALALGGLARRRRADLLFAVPLMAAVSAEALVGHGAWQGWWPAAIAGSCLLARAGGGFEGESA